MAVFILFIIDIGESISVLEKVKELPKMERCKCSVGEEILKAISEQGAFLFGIPQMIVDIINGNFHEETCWCQVN